MTVSLAKGYNALATLAEENIFTTPARKKAGWIALAVTSSAFSAFYLGFPKIPSEYGQNMVRVCGGKLITVIQQLPERLQFINTTEALRCFPHTQDSCGLRSAAWLGRLGLSSLTTFMIPSYAFRKVFALTFDKQKQA